MWHLAIIGSIRLILFGYRVSNGAVEGSFKAYLRKVLPKIKARLAHD